ncbi:MAG: L-aspartate oxidase [Armatimonadetes bacterium]|nr:L-aspartate oxidase [Armatimonadota bacterium]MDW8122910.1 L-aspartate oxidase [Armatimonadota bacterium]
MIVTEDRTDILIIGGGIAGLWCAVNSSPEVRKVVLVKGDVTDCNTYWAQGGIAASLCPRDHPDKHFLDTILAGKGLCNEEAVRVLVDEAPREVAALWKLGVPFDQEDGRLALAKEGAHSEHRVAHAWGDATGRATMEVLLDVVRKQGAEIKENRTALRLLCENGQCWGALVHGPDGLEVWWSKVTVLATGGVGNLYAVTTNSPTATGDGLALGFWAGAELVDLEFVQFHPTALAVGCGPRLLISEAVRGEGAYLLNVKGYRFMPDYHPLAELGPRDVVARAIFDQMQETGADRVYLDISHRGEDFVRKRFPSIYQGCLERGWNLGREPVPVAPAAHYHMGGIRTDLWGRTSVARLFACGECAGTGVHGANRLASNSLAEGLVFGHRVACALTEWLDKPYPSPSPDLTFEDASLDEGGIAPLQDLMTQYVGVVRNEEGLRKAKESFEQIGAQGSELLKMRSLVCWLICSAALERTESRGAHFRSDSPQPDDPRWRVRILWKSSGGLPWEKGPIKMTVAVDSVLTPAVSGGG